MQLKNELQIQIHLFLEIRHKMNEFLNFFEALQELSQGHTVSRMTWKPTNQPIEKLVFVSEQTLRSVTDISYEDRLPLTVREEVANRSLSTVFFGNEFSSIDKHNVVKSWTPSEEDMLTVDWFLVR